MELLVIVAFGLVIWMVLKLTIKPLWQQYKCLKCGRVFDSLEAADAHSAGHAHRTVPL